MTLPLFPLPPAQPGHPAQYTEALYPTMARMLKGCKRIIDPFGGKGGVFQLEWWLPQAEISAVEIEPEWSACHPKTEQGNALYLRWEDDYFDGVCTSPTYGNEMAVVSNKDNWTKDWKTYRYADMIGRRLNKDNSGILKWGAKYQDFHRRAWTEARRVLKPFGIFVLNIKDHIRAGVPQPVTLWHCQALHELGFVQVEHVKIACPGMRWGANADLRIPYESVVKFELRK